MRRGIVVLVFFIIVLLITAGCISAQNGTPTGPDTRNPAPGTTNVKTTPASLPVSPSDCGLPSPDPIRFQKFLPEVSGWTGQTGGTIYYALNIENVTKSVHRDNQICEGYQISDTSNAKTVYVCFLDKGPCVTGTTGVTAFFNEYKIATVNGDTLNKIDNFHGYTAIRLTDPVIPLLYYIGINNRLYVSVRIQDLSGKGSLSEKEADIEKFMNAIDFKGFAASV